MNRTNLSLGLVLPLIAACQSDIKVGTFNSPPTAAITSHQDGDEVFAGAEVLLVGNASDADNTADSLQVTWVVGGLEVCPEATINSDGLTSCTTVIEEGKGTVSLQVKDPGNELGQANITLSVIANEAPVPLIVSPVDGGKYYSDQVITFEGSVSDAEDSSEQVAVAWKSDQEGDLAITMSPDSVGVFSGNQNLSQGTHLITLTATDTVGKTGTDSVTIDVGPPNSKPTCAITSPSSGSAGEQGELIEFAGEVSDADIDSDLLTVQWSSDKDGSLGTSTPTSGGDVLFLFSGLSPDAHVITMTVTDEIGATCSDLVSYTVGTAPSISLAAPLSGESYKLGQYIGFNAAVADSEDSPTDLLIDWSSSIDGSFSAQGADSTGVAQFQYDSLSEGNHALTVTVTDTTGLFATAVANVEVVANTAPSIASVSIDPDPAYVTGSLTCSYSGFNDPDGDADLSIIEWKIGGTVVATGATLATNFVKGDNVKCVVTPSDGTDEGTKVSATRTISNSAPSIAGVTISPSAPAVGDTLTCSYAGFDDPDGDSDLSEMAWSINGSSAGSGTTLSSGFSGGDTVTCTATPNDGVDAGAPVSASVTVENSLPTVTDVTISPDPAYATDSLGCSYTFNDADGDGDASSMEWFINGVSAGTGSTLMSGFVRGDEVECTVTPNDGIASGTPDSGSVTISNTAPTVNAVIISPSNPTETDTLTCTWSFNDIDGDTDSSDITWAIGSTESKQAAP